MSGEAEPRAEREDVQRPWGQDVPTRRVPSPARAGGAGARAEDAGPGAGRWSSFSGERGWGLGSGGAEAGSLPGTKSWGGTS